MASRLETGREINDFSALLNYLNTELYLMEKR